MGAITLVTGGSRSGKSAWALALAERSPGPRIFVATCPAVDAEMERKIDVHRRERVSGGWRTVEEQLDLAGAIAAAGDSGVILVDCLTLWINNLMYRAERAGLPIAERDVEEATAQVVRAALSARCPVIFVTNEVGLGIVPPDAPTRLYRNLVGRCGQAVAAAAASAVLVVCGCALTLKGEPLR